MAMSCATSKACGKTSSFAKTREAIPNSSASIPLKVRPVSHWTLPRLVGLARAADILLTGRTFNGIEAYELGIASRVFANDEVLPQALEVAHDIAVNTAPVSVAISKRLLWESFSMTSHDMNQAESALHQHLMGKADAREGVTAFLDRREPKWSLTVNENWPKNWPENKNS